LGVHDASAVTTFLFTDIEDSTRLWEQEPERMRPALACHDALARTAVECHRGTVVKTTGDGLYAAFDQPLDAIGATLQLQQALTDSEATNGIALRVRCGLHLGVVERRDNDYFGNAVNRTARIMGVAHGGQVIVSQAVVDRVADRLPPQVALRDLGAVRLKGVARPERVYQVIHPRLRQDFPALRSLEATPNNLPQQITSFVGRERALAEVRQLTNAATATLDYRDILKNDRIKVVYISTTPESNHYPIARDCLKAGKHVLLEKPIALELFEADELIEIARRGNLKFTIGYSQRFNPKLAYAKKKIADGTLGRPVSVMVSRHLSRSLGKKISSRGRLSPATMESTHDLDFVFWLLEPARPIRVYSQGAYGYMEAVNGSYDIMWSTVTMDNGVLVSIGGGWNLPPSYPNYCATTIEITGTEGSLFLDDTQRDNWLNTMKDGTQYPMSTMPGEWVDHVFAGQMGPETMHFLECVLRDQPPMVSPESARRVMETYLGADLSAESGEPIALPLNNQSLSAVQDLYKKFRTPV